VRRAAAALVVTAVAVWQLASYRTRPAPEAPPPVPSRSVAATPRIEPGPPPRRGPGVRVGRGPLVATPFSSIQVEATLVRGRLAGVRTLALTGSDAHTNALNARAEPILRRSALRARSADVDVVSGATSTSERWIESLRAAIEDARDGRRG
jgi:hypothetical protein